MKNLKSNKKGFSIIEILVGMFVFSMWIVSVYLVIHSIINMNDYNKNYIVTSNLAREQIELVRNIRDSNYQQLKKYNQINPANAEYDKVFEVWKSYIIENDYRGSADFPIRVTEITNLADKEMYRMCLDSKNRYTYTYGWTNPNCVKELQYFSYVTVAPVEFIQWATTQTISDALKFTSKVEWHIRWKHNFKLPVIIADWKRL